MHRSSTVRKRKNVCTIYSFNAERPDYIEHSLCLRIRDDEGRSVERVGLAKVKITLIDKSTYTIPIGYCAMLSMLGIEPIYNGPSPDIKSPRLPEMGRKR